MKALKNVWELVEKFTENPKYVEISEVAIESVVEELKTVNIGKDPLPECINNHTELLEYELIANSVNYCY